MKILLTLLAGTMLLLSGCATGTVETGVVVVDPYPAVYVGPVFYGAPYYYGPYHHHRYYHPAPVIVHRPPVTVHQAPPRVLPPARPPAVRPPMPSRPMR